MNEKGYGVMSIKKEVIEEIKTKAKEEEKTISVFLSDLLKQPYSNKEEKEYSNDTATEIKELKEALYSNSIATNKEGKEKFNGTTYNGLTKEDLKSIKDVVNEAIAEARTY